MPRFRLGSINIPPFIEPMVNPPVEITDEQQSIIPPSESCPLTDDHIVILRGLTAEAIDRCCRAMRNGTPGSPTSSEKGVLRRIANDTGVDDVIALSWSPTYKLYFP